METPFWIVFVLGLAVAVLSAQVSTAVERGSVQWKVLTVVAGSGFVLSVATAFTQYRL